MLKKILASTGRDELREAAQAATAAAERLKEACKGEKFCPFIEKPDFIHVRSPR